MTVKELIIELLKYDMNLKVVQAGYADRVKTVKSSSRYYDGRDCEKRETVVEIG